MISFAVGAPRAYTHTMHVYKLYISTIKILCNPKKLYNSFKERNIKYVIGFDIVFSKVLTEV